MSVQKNNGRQVLATSPSGDIEMHMGDCPRSSSGYTLRLILRKKDDVDTEHTRGDIKHAVVNICVAEYRFSDDPVERDIRSFVAVSVWVSSVGDNLCDYCQNFLAQVE